MTATKEHWTNWLPTNACSDAVEWSKQASTLAEAWRTCERGDWMLWLLGRLAGKPMSRRRKKLVLAACECARLALKHVKKGEKRPLKAIETAEKWARGDSSISVDDIRASAADAAYAAASAAASAASAASAADAAYAAYAAASAASAASAAYAADADDARNKILERCADIVRKYYPNPPRLLEKV